MFVPLAFKEVCGQVLSGISQQISDAPSLSPPESSNSALLETPALACNVIECGNWQER